MGNANLSIKNNIFEANNDQKLYQEKNIAQLQQKHEFIGSIWGRDDRWWISIL